MNTKTKVFYGMISLSAAMVIVATWWSTLGELTPVTLGITGGIMFVITLIIWLGESAN